MGGDLHLMQGGSFSKVSVSVLGFGGAEVGAGGRGMACEIPSLSSASHSQAAVHRQRLYLLVHAPIHQLLSTIALHTHHHRPSCAAMLLRSFCMLHSVYKCMVLSVSIGKKSGCIWRTKHDASCALAA